MERNYIFSTFTPNDPLWPSQWTPRRIHAGPAWDMELGENSVIVAVIDTGIGYNTRTWPATIFLWATTGSTTILPLSMTAYRARHTSCWNHRRRHTQQLRNCWAFTGQHHGREGLGHGRHGTVYDVAKGVIDATNRGANVTYNSYGSHIFSAASETRLRVFLAPRYLEFFAAAGNQNTGQPLLPGSVWGIRCFCCRLVPK